jgi:N-acetylmuramoyl-L-alanine amidase
VTASALWGLAVAATVVLDPGHGGEESGAIGVGGLVEKDVALGVAREARALLNARGVRVVLTRSTDATLSLGDRIARAHRVGAEAFVSIHLNSSPVRGRRGVETYVASVEAIEDEDVTALVAREEASSEAEAETLAPLASLLDDLDQQAAHRRSATLAAEIQGELAEVDALGPSRGLRQAPFFVLERARVPAVLVEVGYATNPDQATHLATAAGQRAAARAIAEGILQFLGQ